MGISGPPRRHQPHKAPSGDLRGRATGWTQARFLREMTAEDLAGGDMEYVEWAGEAKLLEGLTAELGELEHARYRFS